MLFVVSNVARPQLNELRLASSTLFNTLRAMLLRVLASFPETILPPMVPSIDCELSRITITLGLTAVGRLLASLDITPQKPLRRAYERDPQQVLIHIAAVLTIWSMAYYLQKALPEIRAKAR